MKRLLYILLCLPLWLACTDEHIPTSYHEVEEGTPVELRMSVALGEMNIASSRAFGDYIADYPSLWVVAFDKDGYLVEYAKATGLKRLEGGTLHETEFSVILHATSEPRTLHFIANYTDGDEKLSLEYGHESNVIGSLTVGNKKDVYWHRKVLSEGINTQSEYIAANFRRIPLLRNFAKITVEVDSKVKNFTLTGFYVLNVPTSGTVAPYSNGAFVDYMSNEEGKTEEAKTYEKLNEENYIGTMPDDVGYGQNGSSIDWVKVTEEEPGSFYMYENTYKGVENKTTSILIKGKFGDSSTETYYRADLTLSNVATGLSEYYHILRNFHYQLNITSVIAAGKGTPEAAIEAPANNNLSGSVQVQNLSNISNGTAKLEVSYTDMVLVSTDKVTLKYRFITNVGTGSVNNNRIMIYKEDGNVIDTYTVAQSNELDENGNDTGWRVITITPVGTLPASAQKQKITLYDEETMLRREVTYTLRSKLDMVVNCTPKVESITGESVVVNICIPDKLNENLFPLEFAIEAQTVETSSSLKQYISPAKTEVMSVTTGGSIVTGYEGQRSYQYIKELTYETYKQLQVEESKRVFPVNFVTNTANSASTVYVDNKYFNKGSDFFVNTLPALVDTEFYGVGKDVFYMYEATAAGTYTLTATNATFGTSGESISVRLGKDDIYETVLKTTTWSDHTSVQVGSSTKPGTTTRNKLAMKATSTSGEGLVASTELHVYLSEDAAKAMTDASYGKFTNGTLTTSYKAIITANGLQETTPLYFAYGKGDYVYVASTTAEALAEGTATLNFVGHEKPLVWSAELIGEQYYGGLNFGGQKHSNAVKTVTLNLETNIPGTYTVTFNEVNTQNSNSPYSETKTITVEEGYTTGTATYSTNDWSGAISATVTYKKDANSVAETLDVDGDKRNVLHIKANSITGNNLSDTQDIKISTNAITNNWNSATALIVTNKKELEGNGIEIEIDTLGWNTIYYINYLYDRTYSSDRYYRKDIYVYQLTSNEDINGFQYY